MTVKALEELVGMTRANIRFYEQEGLLNPARRETDTGTTRRRTRTP